MSKLNDLTGQRFNGLVVTERAENSKGGKARWRCKCDCGADTVVTGGNLKSDAVKSCGCLVRSPERLSEGSIAYEVRSRDIALFAEQFKTVGLDTLPETLVPKRPKGRQSLRAEALYGLQVARFCELMRQIQAWISK
jgi:hypothetical protein